MKKPMLTTMMRRLLLLSLISTQALAASVQDMMWGLHNRGQQINTSINPMQTYRLQAIAGEDIHMAMPVKGRKVKVAVLDTGLDTTHPALAPCVYTNTAKCAAYEALKQCIEQHGDSAGVDACRETHLGAAPNVYPADCHGWSILDQDLKQTPNGIIGRPDFTDADGHGSHVAGIIASVSQNVEIIPVQVVGQGPNQPIKPFSITPNITIDLSPSESVRNGYTSDYLSERISRGIIYAMNSGAEVINLSMGWPENQNTDIGKAAIAEAQRRGIIIVAAAGNDSTGALLRPCQYKGVICVAAHGPDGAIASFSNFGFGVDIAAPGVEIVSTTPMQNRSIRLPGLKGYDAMSGTSQATPFVTGVVADMLARGVPAADIYPRLMVGARAAKKDLPILVGPVSNTAISVNGATAYQKTVLSGLLDMNGALQATPQPLILPANKETQLITWDRQSRNMRFNMALKNYWQTIDQARIQIMVRPTHNSDIEAQVVEVTKQQGIRAWSRNEEKNFIVNLTIKDQSDAALSRVPSELSYQVYVYVNSVLVRQFEQKAEIVVSVSTALQGPDIEQFALNGNIPRDLKLTLVDEILDQQMQQRDYFAVPNEKPTENSFNIALVRSSGSQYNVERIQNIKFDGDISMTRPQYKIRGDIDGDGRSEYIYGLIEYLDKDSGIYGDYRNHFFIFDDQMNLKKYVKFDDKRAALPYTFYWMKINGQMRPAWVGRGQEINSKIDITDIWGVDGSPDDVATGMKTKSDLHMYYLNEDFKLAQIPAPSASERIVDVIQPSLESARQGLLTVLIAKNAGTELKPSYISEFSVATVQNARLSSARRLNSMASGLDYRNLIDTFADKTLSLKAEASEFRGMMWYGLDSGQRQRVTMLDMATGQLTDHMVSAQRKVNDNALLIKAGYQAPDRKGVFLITNSELEYHDLVTDEVVSTSLNRYSFFGDANFVQLYFPITLTNSKNPSEKLPAVFTTESSGLSRGMRILTALYGQDGKLQQLVTPARLRLKSENGCKPLESPVFLGDQKGYAMDYRCENRIMRVLLKY